MFSRTDRNEEHSAAQPNPRATLESCYLGQPIPHLDLR